MTRKRSSPMGLEIYLPVLLAFIMMPLLVQAAPLQDYTEIQQYTEGCYYNYNHYNEGDRIMTNEPCLNCTCHNKMLMCYLRVCPFTKPIGHDCIVEKREDQCCPIITCPEVPVDVSHAAPEPGTELSFPEKFGCSIDGKFYLEGAQVPSNPSKPCELCYCIKNRTSCLMQECTLHIDGCTPIYNKGSCCPVRYNCDHENDVLELEDHSTTTEAATTTTTERPTTGFIITSTMTPTVSTDCLHNGDVYADGARITGESACDNCYCMRGDIICARQECHIPMLNGNGKACHPLPAAEGECCPSNYACEDDSDTTQIYEATTLPYDYLDKEVTISTSAPVKDLHGSIPEEDLQLQAHIDEEETATKTPPSEFQAEEEPTEAAIVSKPSDKPIIATEKQDKQGDEQESVTKGVEDVETTTVLSSDGKPVESKESTTKSPISGDQLPESSTELPGGAEYEVKAETTEKTVSVSPAQKVKDTVTKVPIDTDELPEISTGSSSSDEEYTTPRSQEDTHEAGEEFVTNVPEDNVVESQSITEISPTKEEVPEESTESADEVKPIVNDVTKSPIDGEDVATTESDDKQKKPIEFDETATEAASTGEEEHKKVETETKEPLDVESATQTVEEGQDKETGTKLPHIIGQEDEITTETPYKSSEEQEVSTEVSAKEAEELSTKTPITDTESIANKPEESEEEKAISATTDPNKILSEEEKATEKPKVETEPEDTEKEQKVVTVLPTTSEEQEQTTGPADEKEPELSTEASTEFPVPANEQLSSTTASKVEEEMGESSTDKVPTKTPIITDSISTEDETEGSADVPEESSGEGKPAPEDERQVDVTTTAPIKSDENYTTIPAAEIKPGFADDHGSGDFATEIPPKEPSEISSVRPATETVTSIPQEPKEEYTTAKPFITTEQIPKGQETSEESAESEEDNKLIDLTTVKTPESDSTTAVADDTKDDAKQVDITTYKPYIADSTTSAETTEEISEKENATKVAIEDTLSVTTITPVKTADEEYTKDETSTEDKVDITTMATLSNEEIPTKKQEPTDEHKDKLLAETEVSDTPSTVVAFEKDDSSDEEDKIKPDISEESSEPQDFTTSKTIEESVQQTTTSPEINVTTEGEKDEHKVIPETDDHKLEEQPGSTDSPTASIEEEQAITTKPITPEDIRTGPKTDSEKEQKYDATESQKPFLDIKDDFEGEAATSTAMPFVEPVLLEEMHELQLPSVIPGEGDCLVGQKTYENNTIVPSSDECEIMCRCVSSIVICERVKCEVPENIENCILDESGTNKCCPQYICGTGVLHPNSEESVESIEEDEDEDVHQTTVSTTHKQPTIKPVQPDTDKSEITTIKSVLSSEGVSADVNIPEIEMPITITEEPMSHVKDEDEIEQETVKSSTEKIEEDKNDITDEVKTSTTPAAVIEHTSPVKISEQEQQETSTEKTLDETTEKKTAPDVAVILERTEDKIEHQTTLPHDLVESSTDSAVQVPSDEKDESEMYTTPAAPLYEQTVKPTENGKLDDKEPEPETQTSIPITLTEEETATSGEISEEHESHTSAPFAPSTEEVMQSETQTASPSVPLKDEKETTEESHTVPSDGSYENKEPAQEPEAQTIIPLSVDDISAETMSSSGEEQEETSDEIESTTTAKFTELLTTSTESEEKETSTAETSKDHAIDTDKQDITYTTASPLDDGFTHESFTTKASNEIGDHTVQSEVLDKELEITSTFASITDNVDLPSYPSKEHDKEVVDPTKEDISEQNIENTTLVSEISSESFVETATSAQDENLEHTVSSIAFDEHKETSEKSVVSTTVIPEDKQYETSSIEDDTGVPSSTVHGKDDKEKETQTSPSISEGTDITTEKPTDFESKIDTSSPIPATDEVHAGVSSHDMLEDMSTTVASAVEKVEEGKEPGEDHTIGSFTDDSVEHQTESADEGKPKESTEVSIEKVTVSTEEENIIIPSIEQVKDELKPFLDHTVTSLVKDEESSTKSPFAYDKYTPEGGIEHTTTRPITSDESASDIISSEEDIIPVKEDEIVIVSEADKFHESTTAASDVEEEVQSTRIPARQPSLDLSEEESGESAESEEEISTVPTKIHHMEEFVTKDEEATYKPTMKPFSEEDKEASGEEGENVDEMESTTKKPHVPTIEQEGELFVTTEHSDTSEKHEVNDVSTDKLSEEDISFTETPIAKEEFGTKTPISSEQDVSVEKTEEVTKASLDNENTEHDTTQQTLNDIISTVTEGAISVDDIEHITIQQPEGEESITGEQLTTAQPKKEEVLAVTQATIELPEKEKNITGDQITTAEPKKEEVLAVTVPTIELEGISSKEPVSEGLENATNVPISSENVESSTAQQTDIEDTSTTNAPIAAEDVSDQQLKDKNIPDVTKTPESADKIEEVAILHPIDEDILDVTNSPTVPEEVERTTGQQPEEQDVGPSTIKTPPGSAVIHAEDESSLGVTNSPMVSKEVEHITEQQPEEQDVGPSTIKTPLAATKYPIDSESIDATTVKQHVHEEEISDVTKSPVAPEDIDTSATQVPGEVDSQRQEDIELTTAKYPFKETFDATTPHHVEHTTGQKTDEVYDEDMDTATAKLPEELDILSVTQIPTSAEDINISTTEPLEESSLKAEADDAKLPVQANGISVTEVPFTELEKESDETHESDEVTTAKLPEVADHVTELPTVDALPEQESNENATKMPVVAEVSTDKLHVFMEPVTELPTKDAESEDEEGSPKVSETEESTAKLPEVVSELPTKDTKDEVTELPVESHVSTEQLSEFAENFTKLPTKEIESEEEESLKTATELPTDSQESLDELPENETELPTKDFESEKESQKTTTELPTVDEVSTDKLLEHHPEYPTKEAETEVEKIHEQTTDLPVDEHVSTIKLPEHITELPSKDIESETESHEQQTELPVDVESSTNKLHEHITELPTTNLESEEDKTTKDEIESHERVTELPVDAEVSTSKLPERITESPTKDIESEKESHDISTDELPEHITEKPSKDVQPQKESHEEATELPSISMSSEKLPESAKHTTELPAKDAESDEESDEDVTELPVVAPEVSTSGQALEQSTETALKEDESFEETSTEAAEDISSVKLHPATTVHPLFPHHTTLPSAVIDSRVDDSSSHRTPAPAKHEEAFTTSTTTTISSTTTEPVTTSAPHYQPQPPIYGQPPQYGPTQYEDEYTDEDEGEVFGPGTCRYGGKLYVSAQQIPRDDPCDFCFCFRSDIICLQQSCPPPIAGCHEEPISGFCCPRYECPVSMATVLNITTSTTTTSTTLPPHFLHHSYGNNVQRNGCLINGRSYRVGEKIESTSGPCINCTCGGDGKMKCDPQACVPEPTMQQVMAVVAAGRKR